MHDRNFRVAVERIIVLLNARSLEEIALRPIVRLHTINLRIVVLLTDALLH